MALDPSDLALLSDLLREIVRNELDRARTTSRPETPASEATMITQRNCEIVLGLSARQYLELLRRSDAPPVYEIGKARMVRRDEMSAYLTRFRAVTCAPAVEPDGADDVLREIGCTPTRRR